VSGTRKDLERAEIKHLSLQGTCGLVRDSQVYQYLKHMDVLAAWVGIARTGIHQTQESSKSLDMQTLNTSIFFQYGIAFQASLFSSFPTSSVALTYFLNVLAP
jgi:hypothetical protein